MGNKPYFFPKEIRPHAVMPMHFVIAVSCRKIGFDNLTEFSGTKFPTLPLKPIPTAYFWESRIRPTLIKKDIDSYDIDSFLHAER